MLLRGLLGPGAAAWSAISGLRGLVLLLLCLGGAVRASEITFELPDNAKQCFYEEIAQGTKCTLEFQVITGGHYDVDCRLEDPDGNVLYKEMKKQYDSFTFTASRNGTYKFCFSNEFSTFTHKTVYFDFQVGEDPPLFPSENRVTALTQLLIQEKTFLLIPQLLTCLRALVRNLVKGFLEVQVQYIRTAILGQTKGLSSPVSCLPTVANARCPRGNEQNR
ncbi:transmembrane emp24 domain-containing protein 7 isoform X2 [Lepidochelys kempii]|uniref:transmembrane emp24 domain-containing protein 7 isoform X2 n=1 Tax=Lepidochelys kempii TaxID=8472 RepID=UPI003C6EB3AF